MNKLNFCIENYENEEARMKDVSTFISILLRNNNVIKIWHDDIDIVVEYTLAFPDECVVCGCDDI